MLEFRPHFRAVVETADQPWKRAAGVLTLRLRGIFFAIATIALVVIMETLFINWRYAGGATGLQLLRPAPLWPFQSYIPMLFVVMALMAVAAVATARYIERSWIGRGLRALLLSSVQQIVTVTISNEINVLVVGILLVFFVVAAPSGIIGFFRKWLSSK